MIHIVFAALCFAAFAGVFFSMLMMGWRALRIAGMGHGGLLINGLRFFDRRQHPPEVRPHIQAMWWWFRSAAVFFVLFGIGLVLQ